MSQPSTHRPILRSTTIARFTIDPTSTNNPARRRHDKDNNSDSNNYTATSNENRPLTRSVSARRLGARYSSKLGVMNENAPSTVLDQYLVRQKNSAKEKKAITGERERMPLGMAMVNSQALPSSRMQPGDGMTKRKARNSGGRETKMPRLDEVPSKVPNQKSTTPVRTPPRSSIPSLANQQPTPAREILKHRFSSSSLEDEDGDPGASPPAMVARPPTPPRPHLPLSQAAQASTTPGKRNLSTISPSRTHTGISLPQHRPSLPVTPSRLGPPPATPTKTMLHVPVTPVREGLAPSPRRVMGSISKFRSGISPSPAKPVMAMAPPKFDLPSVKSGDETSTMTKFTHDNDVAMETAREEALTESGTTTMVGVRQEMGFDIPQVVVEAPMPQATTTAKPTNIATKGSMLPPSRIPTRIPRTASTLLADPAKPSINASLTRSKPSSTLGKGFPSSSTVANLPQTSTAEKAVKRKPSYPSSLGSGPLAKPRDRMVSGPVLHPRSVSTRVASHETPVLPKSPRSVSAPVPRVSIPSEENRLSSSTTRREGFSMETSKSLVGLNEALMKLKVRKSDVGISTSTLTSKSRQSLGSFATPASANERPNSSTSTDLPPAEQASSRLAAVHRSRQSLALTARDEAEDMSMSIDEHPGDRSLAALMCSTSGGGCLKGVVAFVDVRTEDGDEAGGVFVEMLKGLGARVLSRPTENCTHLIYKSGKSSTISWYRKQDEGERPHLVGISWVTKSKEKGQRQEEGRYAIDLKEVEEVFQKRRKSMEPKALGLGGGLTSSRPSSMFLDVSFAQAKRKSLLYAPKISSPLKKGYRSTMETDEE